MSESRLDFRLKSKRGSSLDVFEYESMNRWVRKPSLVNILHKNADFSKVKSRVLNEQNVGFLLMKSWICDSRSVVDTLK